MLRALGLLLFVACQACGAALQTTTLSMRALDCASCAEPALARLRSTPGVVAAEFDRPSAELRIRHEAERVDPATLARLVTHASSKEVVVGAGQGAYVETAAWPPSADVKHVAGDGELRPVPGKVTVFDFYARWCGPCRVVDKALIDTSRRLPELAVRKLDIGDWGSPVAEKYADRLGNLPHVEVYGRDGRQVAVIDGLDLERLAKAIEEANR